MLQRLSYRPEEISSPVDPEYDVGPNYWPGRDQEYCPGSDSAVEKARPGFVR